MTQSHIAPCDREANLDEVLAAYWRGVESGNPPDRRQLLELYPEISAELGEYFADQDRVEQWTRPLRTIGQATTQPDRLAHADESLVGCCVGDYELLAEIGRGGMGVVYRARQKSLDRLLAVKLILSDRLASEHECQRFRHEADAAAHLDHPRIVPVYEIGSHSGRPFFSMKLFEGGSVAERLDSYRANPRRAVDLVVAVASAVHHAHQRGLLHRDLKPSNILLDADGQPHVADFGLAKWQDLDQGQTQSGMIVGTPTFMAPEQAATSFERNQDGKGAATTKSDVYSLGAILYTLLSGQPPFRGVSPLDTLALLKDSDPIPPSRSNPQVDRDLEAICLKCLEKEPARRYGSAEALAEDLERWLNGEPTRARPITRVDRAWRWCRRNPLLAGLTALVAALLVAGVAGLTVGLVVVSHARKMADDQRSLLRQRLYAADLTRANRLWQEGQMDALATVLAEYEPRPGETDLRGFEWHFLTQQVRRSQQIQPKLISRGRPGVLYYAATISTDCKTAAGASGDKRIDVVDLETGEQRTQISGLSADVNWLSFSPDGQLLATASLDSTIRLWNVASGTEEAILTGHQDRIHCVVFSPDGKKLASCGRDQRVRIWDVASRAVEFEFPLPTRIIEAVAFSPDGRKVAAADHDSQVTIWDLSSGQSITVQAAGRALAVAFSPDGNQFAAADDHGIVHVWQTATGQLVRTLMGNQGFVRSVQFSPDGELLASCGDDGRVRLLSASDGTVRSQFRAHEDVVWSVSFSRDGQTLATNSTDQTIKLWSRADVCESPSVVSVSGLGLYPLRFSPDLRRLATSSKQSGLVQLWQTANGQLEANLPGHAEEVYGLSFSRDGRFLAASGEKGLCILWDLASQLPVRDQSGTNKVCPGVAAVFTPDNATVISSAWDEATVSERATGRVLHQIKANGRLFSALSLTLSPDGTIAAVGRGTGEICFWDWATGSTRSGKGGHRTGVTAVAFTPDGSILASMSRDGSIKLSNVSTGDELATLKGHSQGGSLAFSVDGKTLASAGWDGAVRLWHVATAQELFSLEVHPGSVLSIAFSPDGQTLATAGTRPDRPEVEYFFWSANSDSQARKNTPARKLEVEAHAK